MKSQTTKPRAKPKARILLYSTLVQITTSTSKTTGFFVARNTILTSLPRLKHTDHELITIHHGKLQYKIIKISTHPDFEIVTIQIDIDEDADISCFKLNTNYRSKDTLYVCPYSLSGFNFILVNTKKLDKSGSEAFIEFTSENIQGNLCGSPLLNFSAGTVCGVVSSQASRIVDRQNKIVKTIGQAISAAAIFTAFPAIKELNHKFNSALSLSNLPTRNYHKFIGRDSELKQLLEYISTSYRQHIIVIDGTAGIGKTALVLKAAYTCLQTKQNENSCGQHKIINTPTFDSIVFTTFKNKNTQKSEVLRHSTHNTKLLLIIQNIATTLNQPEIGLVYKEEQFGIVYRYLAKQPTLLIIDGLEDLTSNNFAEILTFLNDLPRSTKVIITTREQSLSYSHISLKSLPDSESQQFIHEQFRQKDTHATAQIAKQIASSLQGLPIAMIYAIGQYTAGYETDLNSISTKSFSKKLDLGRFYFEASVNFLKGEPAYDLLISLAFFRDPPCRDALVKVADLENEKFIVDDALNKLQKLSLIIEHETEEGQRYSLLPITREYALAELATLSQQDIKFEKEARYRWVDWYRDFTKKYGSRYSDRDGYTYHKLQQELENIGEVLSWSATHGDYNTVKEIWNEIDDYIVDNRYWIIRFYWWEYLEKESRKRAEMPTYVKALSEKAVTGIEMGVEYCPTAKESLMEASSLDEYADKTVKSKLNEYLSRFNKVCGNMMIRS